MPYDGATLSADFGPAENGSIREHVGSGMFRNISCTATAGQLQNLLALAGDVDGDRDITDFDILASNFVPDGCGASAVPEPSALLLTLLGLMLLAGARVQ